MQKDRDGRGRNGREATMAKRRRRARRGTGSIIAVRQLSGTGLGKATNPSSVLGAMLPPAIGGGLAGGATLLVEYMGGPQKDGTVPNKTMITLAENAPLVGLGVGVLGAGAAYMLLGAPAGVSAAAAAAIVTGTLFAMHKFKASSPSATTEPAAPPSTAGVGRYHRRMRGTGAIVPQLMPQGMGAITMEQVAGTRGLGYGSDPRGETVSLGSVNPGAFGTPGFNV